MVVERKCCHLSVGLAWFCFQYLLDAGRARHAHSFVMIVNGHQMTVSRISDTDNIPKYELSVTYSFISLVE